MLSVCVMIIGGYGYDGDFSSSSVGSVLSCSSICATRYGTTYTYIFMLGNLSVIRISGLAQSVNCNVECGIPTPWALPCSPCCYCFMTFRPENNKCTDKKQVNSPATTITNKIRHRHKCAELLHDMYDCLSSSMSRNVVTRPWTVYMVAAVFLLCFGANAVIFIVWKRWNKNVRLLAVCWCRMMYYISHVEWTKQLTKSKKKQ